MTNRLERGWRLTAAAIVWFAIVLQYVLRVEGRDISVQTIRFFSYFTVLSNILVATTFAASALAPQSRLGVWAGRPGTRVAVGVYIGVTALVYHWLLAGLWEPEGWRVLTNFVLHTVCPLLFLTDLLVLPPREAARWGQAWKALALPFVFGVWTLIHGALSGWYPYPFLNVIKRGYPAVLVTMVVMAAGFFVLTLVLTAVQHLQLRMAKRGRAPISA
ncbi:MAG: Pr6Pr family membrane protein [Caulobacter sp.]